MGRKGKNVKSSRKKKSPSSKRAKKGGEKAKGKGKIRVDERTMVLKIIADASRIMNRKPDSLVEYAYALRDNLFKADKLTEKEYKEVRDFFRRVKIQLLLADREVDFRTVGRIERDVIRIFEEKMKK